MTKFIHTPIFESAHRFNDRPALGFKDSIWSYDKLAKAVANAATGLYNLGLQRSERVAIYLPKMLETVVSIFSAGAAGAVFVPINPLLKGQQAEYILKDCNVRVLITQSQRLKSIQENLKNCADLHTVICIDDTAINQIAHINVASWSETMDRTPVMDHNPGLDSLTRGIEYGPITDNDIAAILYTSGSTGNPKGVVLSHRNMVVGAESVSEYLQNTENDRILAVLPFSFDYGLSQLTTAFNVGASVYLIDYLLPMDIVRAIHNYKITGLAAVPPLWAQLTRLTWPEEVAAGLRYFTNSGGAMPEATLTKLRAIFANASPFLMYGLTEAFRSSYLPPSQVDKRPTSMGKAIPNSEILVVREDGSECAANEPGELVHCGPLVSLGYWNSPDKTNVRFKPSPAKPKEISTHQLAVWSGDTVYKDNDGYLFFVGRMDDMIKTSGYRVSPTEVEETIYSSGLIVDAAAIGSKHPDLGQAIVVVVTQKDKSNHEQLEKQLISLCQKQLPNFMVPTKIIIRDTMPYNANGKIDRKQLASEYSDIN